VKRVNIFVHRSFRIYPVLFDIQATVLLVRPSLCHIHHDSWKKCHLPTINICPGIASVEAIRTVKMVAYSLVFAVSADATDYKSFYIRCVLSFHFQHHGNVLSMNTEKLPYTRFPARGADSEF
jgi:hypothetical protein